MTGFRARTLAVLLTGMVVCMGTGLPAAGAATNSRDVTWAGTYDFYVTWVGHPTALFPITLNANHTGVDPASDVVTWKKTGHNITITITGNGATATYLGKRNKNGFNTKKKQGASSSTTGASGTWYAIY
jgi:hypothetical protein